ncbi:hypothetical protein [Microbacterium sp. VKM Ac-2923]|uniref:hypothetical protein n=1 Tax=Microbacterium sp. VKM Ac-2923 TaxID=2929476 RepID=UPI001FB26509|nr:hypothetical protein [Microbacterium sp. VKM Ac-2923]MCJ1708035.1 hypothetical protein [Microbacterium sp. VKM Ac-2923]
MSRTRTLTIMTNVPGDVNRLRAVIAKIDSDNPLKVPFSFNQGHISPRLDRLEAKLSYMAEYIAYLEQRIEGLEAQVVS